ncbi:ADP-ribosylglycohydrolase family protein [Heliorestis acidaminivorans]|uniref:ADP-ribosylglycohydrolase family protein n=1 Tax=Heliorestis acidaminivorans TaxID=553427 RepID=A0A6I0F212_9FIRM|nr:ADP-ribosylglycohydrolase family protein [Heliorestis acidaminivorans]KAB2950842.1 ADP-ribosylglycohydrolase family protein [Heliorestis acidaminivorans]
MDLYINRIMGAVIGATIGDALGVPVEFKRRAELEKNPVTDMSSGGTHNQPAGTWSDDTSLLICHVESIINKGFDMNDLAKRFIAWLQEGKTTAHGQVFDVGYTTMIAIQRLASGVSPKKSGLIDEKSNGNGSLMRIVPVSLFVAQLPMKQIERYIKEASSITHGHPRSQLACFIFSLLAIQLLHGNSPKSSYQKTIEQLHQMQERQELFIGMEREMSHFSHILNGSLGSLPRNVIPSSGYVIDTLTASIWCLLQSQSYEDCVLQAVNLGEDTDTTAAVAGALAGLYYGFKALPKEWINVLAQKEVLCDLAHQFAQKVIKNIDANNKQ